MNKKIVVFLLLLSLLNYAKSEVAISRADIVFDSTQSLMPSVIQAENGDLICCFQETPDADSPGRLQFVRSMDKGETWSSVYLVLTSKWGQYGCICGFLSKGSNGVLYLAMNDVLAVGGFSNFTSDVLIFKSVDNGQTFTQFAVIPTEDDEFEPISAPIRVLNNGNWILPGYVLNREASEGVACGFWRSVDNGQTWTAHERAFYDQIPGDPNYKAFNEVDIVVRKDGSLLAVARTDAEDSGVPTTKGQLYYTESFDNGYTWGNPKKLDVPGHCPALFRWPDLNGTIMLGCRELKTVSKTSIYLSSNGVNFQFAFDAVEPRSNRNSATGYPTFALMSDDNVYMAFYSGDTSLTWPLQTYCAGNVLHNTEVTSCGRSGYLKMDSNRDCITNFADFAIMMNNWYLSTDPALTDSIDCSDSNNPMCQ